MIILTNYIGAGGSLQMRRRGFQPLRGKTEGRSVPLREVQLNRRGIDL